MLFRFYPVLLPVALVCILANAIISSIPQVFMQKVISLVEQDLAVRRLGRGVRAPAGPGSHPGGALCAQPHRRRYL